MKIIKNRAHGKDEFVIYVEDEKERKILNKFTDASLNLMMDNEDEFTGFCVFIRPKDLKADRKLWRS